MRDAFNEETVDPYDRVTLRINYILIGAIAGFLLVTTMVSLVTAYYTKFSVIDDPAFYRAISGFESNFAPIAGIIGAFVGFLRGMYLGPAPPSPGTWD